MNVLLYISTATTMHSTDVGVHVVNTTCTVCILLHFTDRVPTPWKHG